MKHLSYPRIPASYLCVTWQGDQDVIAQHQQRHSGRLRHCLRWRLCGRRHGFWLRLFLLRKCCGYHGHCVIPACVRVCEWTRKKSRCTKFEDIQMVEGKNQLLIFFHYSGGDDKICPVVFRWLSFQLSCRGPSCILSLFSVLFRYPVVILRYKFAIIIIGSNIIMCNIFNIIFTYYFIFIIP